MTALELLHSLRARGYQLTVEGDNIRVTGGEVTPELRDTLLRYKTDLLAVLAPQQSFVNVRSKLTALEKQLGGQGPEPTPLWIVFLWHDHTHDEAEIEEAKRRIWAAALERYYVTRNESDLGTGAFHVGLKVTGRSGCTVCYALHPAMFPSQDPQQ